MRSVVVSVLVFCIYICVRACVCMYVCVTMARNVTTYPRGQGAACPEISQLQRVGVCANGAAVRCSSCDNMRLDHILEADVDCGTFMCMAVLRKICPAVG